MKNISRLFALLLLPTLGAAAGVRDGFDSAKHPQRQALRGEWKFADQTAFCVSDPDDYKKYKNHGPILRWPCKFIDGTVEFEIKPKDCQRIVITLNEEGHVFRISLNDEQRTRIFGWIGRSSKTNKPKTIAQDGVPTAKAISGQWVKGRLVFKGDVAQVKIGDYSARLKHASIGRKKGEFTISFALGECSFRNVSVTPAD
ncbi:MAG: hypothetical protein ACPGVU_03165 [Limisphaerales bacterium]